MLKIIMGVADGRIRSFSSRNSLVNQKVDLLWNCLAHNSKYSAFSGSLEVNRARLHRIARDMYLLSKVKRVVYCRLSIDFVCLVEPEISHFCFS